MDIDINTHTSQQPPAILIKAQEEFSSSKWLLRCSMKDTKGLLPKYVTTSSSELATEPKVPTVGVVSLAERGRV